LEKIAPEHGTLEGFEVKALVGSTGERTLILNARKVFYDGNGHSNILLAFEDVTERRSIEIERTTLLKRTQDLLKEKDVLLQEMQHRVANSLAIIASILLLKARAVTSDETRQHLQDAHQRVLSVATVQQHIQSAGRADLIEMGPYLKKLCESLSASMVADHEISIKVTEKGNGSALSAQAVSLGLIVMELVINALKHAFPKNQQAAEIKVDYEKSGEDWRLVVSDNGVGKSVVASVHPKGGLGTTLVNALAQQLDAQVKVLATPAGMTVTVTRATFTSQFPDGA
jgi:two-component sensor histidine kinase